MNKNVNSELSFTVCYGKLFLVFNYINSKLHSINGGNVLRGTAVTLPLHQVAGNIQLTSDSRH